MHPGRDYQAGSPLLRWALIEPAQEAPADSPMRQVRERIEAPRPTMHNPGKTVTARKLLTLFFYWMHDRHIRCLTHSAVLGEWESHRVRP